MMREGIRGEFERLEAADLALSENEAESAHKSSIKDMVTQVDILELR